MEEVWLHQVVCHLVVIIIIFLAHQHKAAGRKTRLDIQNYYYYNNNRRFTAIIQVSLRQ